MEDADKKKELARLKRLATELAGQVHDIVEEGLWTRYIELPQLTQDLVAACKRVEEAGRG